MSTGALIVAGLFFALAAGQFLLRKVSDRQSIQQSALLYSLAGTMFLLMSFDR